MTYGSPVFEYDPAPPLRDFEKIVADNAGVLIEDTIDSVKRELEELVPRGHYIGPMYGVQVMSIGCNTESPKVADFFVEVRQLSDNEMLQIPVMTFLEFYRPLATDLM